jgi:hypothetical protein
MWINSGPTVSSICTPQTIEVEPSSSVVGVSKDPTLQVEARKKEYSIVSDGLYATVNAGEAPTWLTSIISTVISNSLETALSDIGSMSDSLTTAISAIDIAKNDYNEFISIQATENAAITSRVSELDATLSTGLVNTNARVTEIDQSYVSAAEAYAISANQTSASLNSTGGLLKGVINDISTANTLQNQTIAGNYNAATEQFDEIDVAYGVMAQDILDVEAKADETQATVEREMTAFAGVDSNGDAIANAQFKVQLKTDVNGNAVIGGFALTNDGNTVSAGFDVDTFRIGYADGNTGTYPFVVDGGTTYLADAMIKTASIDVAKIKQLTANDISSTTGFFSSLKAKFLNIDSGVVQEDFRSSNYNSNSGWRLASDGTLTANEIYARGNIEASSIKTDSANIVNTLNIAGNAVRVMDYISLSAVNIARSWTTIGTATSNVTLVTGTSTKILVTVVLNGRVKGADGNSRNCLFRVLKGGLVVIPTTAFCCSVSSLDFTYTSGTFQYLDTSPVSGNNSYVVQMYRESATDEARFSAGVTIDSAKGV